jgi:hypothetical protein
MIQLTPQLNILLAYQPADFRKEIDGLIALCRAQFDAELPARAIMTTLHSALLSGLGCNG